MYVRILNIVESVLILRYVYFRYRYTCPVPWLTGTVMHGLQNEIHKLACFPGLKQLLVRNLKYNTLKFFGINVHTKELGPVTEIRFSLWISVQNQPAKPMEVFGILERIPFVVTSPHTA